MFLMEIKTALEGAKYHEDYAFKLAHPTKASTSKKNYHALIFHLRAYYWELWSVWDYILQNANNHTLKLKRVDTTLVTEIIKKAPKYTFLSEITGIRDSLSLKRIARLRHSAHKFVLEPYQVELNDNSVTIICLHMRDGAAPKQVNVDRNDFAFVVGIVERLENIGFFK